MHLRLHLGLETTVRKLCACQKLWISVDVFLFKSQKITWRQYLKIGYSYGMGLGNSADRCSSNADRRKKSSVRADKEIWFTTMSGHWAFLLPLTFYICALISSSVIDSRTVALPYNAECLVEMGIKPNSNGIFWQEPNRTGTLRSADGFLSSMQIRRLANTFIYT